MSAEIVLPIITTIISFMALFIAVLTSKTNLSASSRIQHNTNVALADIMLAENPSCLRFHNINPDEIEDLYGVTSSDLCYLLQAFNAGSISNILSSDGCDTPFQNGSYWHVILESEHTRKAFPLLKLLFDVENHFIARCDKTITSIEQTKIGNLVEKGT